MSENVTALDKELNQMILSGQIMPAFDKFYSPNIVMQENNEAPRLGKDVNRKAEEDFMASVEQFHGVKMLGSAVEGDRAYSEWEMDLTFKGGHRATMSQTAARQWKDGQIVHERFYYSK